MKKRLIIEIIVLALVIMGCLLYWQSFNIKKQIAHYYYEQAYHYLDELNNKESTANFIKAINWDPELDSEESRGFRDYRKSILDDPDNFNTYFGK